MAQRATKITHHQIQRQVRGFSPCRFDFTIASSVKGDEKSETVGRKRSYNAQEKKKKMEEFGADGSYGEIVISVPWRPRYQMAVLTWRRRMCPLGEAFSI
ncbi:hypothetical protein TNCV_3798241 [Trichonephila clavipes]|nr:hypothetical protein TNCV_3798241 [Trichonephila clavipes]